jgi:predicted metal-dependent phosphoesterase TrpH
LTTFVNAPNQTIELKGYISLEDKQAAAYKALPFNVPKGITRIEVQYTFSNDEPGGLWRDPGNILDIGLFDPRGSEFLTGEGFRGWSGSALREFAVGMEEATPGYLPGPIPEGQWEIVLGVHRILPEGCDYHVSVKLIPGEVHELKGEWGLDDPILRKGPGWYRGELHCHTHHSEAMGSMDDLLATARAQELDFAAVTEHNTVSHLLEFVSHRTKDLLLIPGMEITTDRGHANVWGIDRWLEFRCTRPEEMARVVEEAGARGALISINHPKEMGPPWTYGLEDEFDCLEVWQLAWFMNNHQSLALWDQLLKEGHRLTAVGGSDYHQETYTGELGVITLGTPCNWVFAEELSVRGVLSGVKAGHVFISENPKGPRVFLEASWEDQHAMVGDQIILPQGSSLHLRCQVEGAKGSELCIRSLDGDTCATIEGDEYTFGSEILISHDTFFRAEVLDPSDPPTIRALTNPIYVPTSTT